MIGNHRFLSKYQRVYLKQLSELSQNILYLDKKNYNKVLQAFEFAAKYYTTKKRLNGDYIIVHCSSVCITLAQLKLDQTCLITALLHELNLEKDKIYNGIIQNFGIEVLNLIKQIKTIIQRLSFANLGDKGLENEWVRQMFVVSANNLCAIIIKIADRINDLESLEVFAPEKIKQIATESLYIDAHIAARIGINKFKNRIEELAFKYSNPEIYDFMRKEPSLNMNFRQRIVENLISKMEKVLKRENIKYIQVKGRAKTFYSIYKKLIQKSETIDKIYDLIGIRVVVSSITDCYNILDFLHKHFPPIHGRLKDYIQNPKNDGYQSLHTTVIDKELSIIFELQIRTKEMDDFVEYGPISHWRYKYQTEHDYMIDFLTPEDIKQLNEILGITHISQKQILYFKKSTVHFNKNIYVFDKNGKVWKLDKGSTAEDFVKKTNPKLGKQNFVTKINGKARSPSQKLKTGDVVEVLKI